MALKITDFLIGLAIISAIITVFMLIVADGAEHYSVTYNTSTFASFNNKTNSLYMIAEGAKTNASNVSTNDGIFDIIGSLAGQGITAVKGTYVSIDLFGDMVAEGSSQIPMGKAGSVYKTMIMSIVLIFIILGVVIALIVKWPL